MKRQPQRGGGKRGANYTGGGANKIVYFLISWTLDKLPFTAAPSMVFRPTSNIERQTHYRQSLT
ncbi:MAG: hypothetical protein OIF34_08345, partial [Porticoccaceae bacterium]|nr:hypothetical protein [Porticoccaceae bacterium]